MSEFNLVACGQFLRVRTFESFTENDLFFNKIKVMRSPVCKIFLDQAAKNKKIRRSEPFNGKDVIIEEITEN